MKRITQQKGESSQIAQQESPQSPASPLSSPLPRQEDSVTTTMESEEVQQVRLLFKMVNLYIVFQSKDSAVMHELNSVTEFAIVFKMAADFIFCFTLKVSSIYSL